MQGLPIIPKSRAIHLFRRAGQTCPAPMPSGAAGALACCVTLLALAAAPVPPRPVPSFLATKIAADHADQALEAVSLWQQFVDNTPAGSPDLPNARAELSHWTDLATTGAELINDHWVSGAERDALIAKAAALDSEGRALLAGNQTLQAIPKLKQSFCLYPNSYSTAVLLGYTSLVQNQYGDATTYLERALVLHPNSPDVLNNLAYIYFHRSRFEPAILDLYKSLQLSDDRDRVQNFVTVLAAAPPGIANNFRLRPAINAARLLEARYDIHGPAAEFKLLPPPTAPAANAAPGANPAKLATATGFLVTPDGYILTNRHVVQNAKTILVLLTGGQKSSADVVAVDTSADLALLHLNAETPLPLPHLLFSDAACPDQGAKCMMLGYPLIDRLGTDPKIMQGMIAGPTGITDPSGADLLLDAKINPGDSGEPVFDPFGRVAAVVCQKLRPANPNEDSYGLAISAGRARKFLADHNIAPPAPPPAGNPLDGPQVAASARPATVCILVTY